MVLMRRHSWSCDAAPLPTAETMMDQSDDILDTPQLGYEAWRDRLRAMCGRYNPEGIEPNAFTGWVRPVSVCGFTALDMVAMLIGSSGRTGMFASMARTTTSLSSKSVASQR
jgi:hypothetical protein